METIRRQIITLLQEQEMNARELSQAVKIQEKEVYTHLSHIDLSVKARKMRLVVQPFQCQLCDFVFENRKRFTPPGRCPQCKKGHIEAATYRIL